MKFRYLVPLAGLLLLAGCGQFFPPLNSTDGGSGSGSGSGSGTSSVGDFLYVANSSTATSTIAGFSLANSALAITPGSAYGMALPPSALAITPSDQWLYVGSLSGAIYAYAIESNGSLSIGNGGQPVATGVSPIALEVDPTGNWLIGADALSPEAYVFGIDSSNGALTPVQASTIPVGNGSTGISSASNIAITPNDAYVYISLGTQGVQTLSFNSYSGALVQINSLLAPKGNNYADRGLAINPAGTFLYVAETGTNGVRIFSISSTNGVLTELAGSPVTSSGDLGAEAVLIDSTGSYLYLANSTSNNVSAFLLSNSGALTHIGDYTTGVDPVAFAEDKTAGYIAVVCAGGNPDLQVFKLDTTTAGALDTFQTATTGTDPTDAFAIVATH